MQRKLFNEYSRILVDNKTKDVPTSTHDVVYDVYFLVRICYCITLLQGGLIYANVQTSHQSSIKHMYHMIYKVMYGHDKYTRITL